MMQITGPKVKKCGIGIEVQTLQNEATAGLCRECLSLLLAASMQVEGVGHSVAHPA